MLAEQAEAAGATGDMRFLGSMSPVSPRERERPFWEGMGEGSGNPQALIANAYRYASTAPHEWGDLGGFDPQLSFGEVLSEQGFEGWRNLAGQIALGVIEPGPADLARMASFLVGIPMSIQKMLAKRIHPSLIDVDGTPLQQYHGTPRVYDRATGISRNFSADLRGHHTTPDPTNASDFALQPTGGYGPGSNVRMETPAVRRVLETRSNVPMKPDEAADLQRSLEGYYRGKIPDDVLDETLRYVDDLQAGGEPFDIRHLDRIYDELTWNWKKTQGTSAPGPTRYQILRRGGWEGYSDLDEVYEFEFLTFDPAKNIIRAGHVEDATDWLLRQPDLTPAEMNAITRIMQELGLEGGAR